MFYRTHTCGELRKEDAGKKVKLSGWLDSKRDKGGLLFAVLRDFYGTTQVVATEEPCLSALRDIPTESTVSIEGTVALRSARNYSRKGGNSGQTLGAGASLRGQPFARRGRGYTPSLPLSRSEKQRGTR